MLSAVYGHFGPKTVRHYVFSTEIYYFFSAGAEVSQRHFWDTSAPVPKCLNINFYEGAEVSNEQRCGGMALNVKANHGLLNLYQLIQLLHAESQLVDVSVRMLSECGTTRLLQKNAYSKA